MPEPKLNGYQKLISLDLKLEAPHGLSEPVTIDATCPQLDGFRFFTLLPWDETTVTVQERFFSDSPELNRERIVMSVRSYAERQGWAIKEIAREERAILPSPMTS